jgi:hypothetical protein
MKRNRAQRLLCKGWKNSRRYGIVEHCVRDNVAYI